MMKILVNARFLTRKITGVERYARELIKILVTANQLEVTLIAPQGETLEPLADVKVIQDNSIFRGHLWEQVRLPMLCNKLKVELLWSPCNVGPISVKNQVVTIHDASVFAHAEGFSKIFTTAYRIILPILGHRVKHVITDTQFSKTELVRYGVVNQQRVTAIHNGVTSIACEEYSNKNNWIRAIGLGNGYVLFVGSVEPRKNLRCLLKAWRILHKKYGITNKKLAIVGGSCKHFAQAYNKNDSLSNVVFLGYVDDAKLAELYKHADCFVFPSIYEGFGHPPLEAMSCGCPTVVSNVASLPEVCGDASYYVNPYSIESIAKGIYEVLTNDKLCKCLIRKGFERVKMFSWEKTARETLRIFQEAMQ